MKHTKGPWRIGDAGFSVFGPKQSDGSLAETIATVKRKENTQLIAAAPELLQALKQLSEYVQSNVTDRCFETGCDCEGNEQSKALMDVVEAAIKKATGE